jgi:hypothetical protein
MMGLARDAIGRAVTRPGLVGRQARIRMQMDSGPKDASCLLVKDDRAVHFGEFTEPSGSEVNVEVEAAACDSLHRAVKAEDDERSGATAENSLESVAQGCTGRNHGEDVAQSSE